LHQFTRPVRIDTDLPQAFPQAKPEFIAILETQMSWHDSISRSPEKFFGIRRMQAGAI
jgi:hypothetical protein